jgi:hypothetical protein
MFFFKRKKIVVDAFTYDVGYYEFGAPQKASRFFPNWWKGVPSTINEVTNGGMVVERDSIRNCVGFIEWYKRGFVIPLWSDLVLETFDDGSYSYQFAARQSPEITTHSPSQYGYAINDVIHCKIEPPWRFQEKTGVYFACVEPKWNYLDRDITMDILPGTVEFQINVSANVNVFFPKADQKMFFKHGDPLYHIIPLSEHELELKTHLVSEAEYEKLNSWSGYVMKFRKNYLAKKKLLNGSGCPFHVK